jgi:hypothetical protein
MGFQASDQHLNLIRCTSCNHWNWPEFTRRFVNVPGLPDHLEEITEIDNSVIDDIDVLASDVVCEKCRNPLDLSTPDLREWVPKYQGRRHARGYHVTPFSTSRLTIPYIITQLLKYKKNDYLRGFHNTVLGMPYSDGNIRLTVEVIEECITAQSIIPKVGSDVPVWVGIDVGQTCHIILGAGGSADTMKPFAFMTCHIDELVDKVKLFKTQYNLIGGAIDRHPYEPTADEVMRVSDGKILPTEYRGRVDAKLVTDEFDDITHAQVDRTAMLDTVVRVIKNGSLEISGYQQYRTILIEHLRDMVRDEKPESPATWVKLTGQDHFFHALGFLLVSPLIYEVSKLHQKVEIRTMAMVHTADMKEAPGGILPARNKPLGNPNKSDYIY